MLRAGTGGREDAGRLVAGCSPVPGLTCAGTSDAGGDGLSGGVRQPLAGRLDGKRRINLDETIGFAEVFGLDLRNLVGPPQLAAKARAMELIDEILDAFRATQRANMAFIEARDALDAYLADHPDVREEADVMVSNAMAEKASKTMLKMHGPPPGGGDTGPAAEA
ncbi:hypothetical protein AB0L85_25565 [Streptomyces sp. NPDC052051]|uniref:hypothetical protein n=1 Tax=Streptomyces sp. NPDC052051 TaxID=3154649 RepID=UPI00343B697B